MGFSGDLGDIGLNDVFHNIGSNRLTGTLRIFNDRRRLLVHFREGKIAMAAAAAGRGDEVPSGATSRAAVRGDKPRRRERRTVRALLKTGGPEADAFRERVRQALGEELYEAFAWTGCQFDFSEGEAPGDVFPVAQEEAAVGLDVDPVLMEAARRTDEWGRIHRQIRSMDEVFVRVSGVDPGDAPEEELAAEVLAQIDGETDLKTIAAERPEGRFAVCKAVADLLRDRWIRPLTVGERTKLALRVEQSGDVERAIRLLTGALEHERNEPSLHENLGELLVKTGRVEEAASALCLAGAAYCALDRDGEALAAYRRAVEIAPSDPGARERLLNLLMEHQDVDTAVTSGLELARLYEELGLLDRARSTYSRLTGLEPDNPDLLVELARCERNLGNGREAVKILRLVAGTALKKGDLDRAKSMLSQILKIQPDHPEARRLLAQAESGALTVKRARRKRVRQLAAWGLGAGVVLYVLSYEVMARTRLHGVQRQAMALIAQGRFLEAIEGYDTLRHSYPLSLARLESGMLIEELARGQITEVERQNVVEDPATALEKLERILTLAVAPDVYERARKQITRLRVQQKVLTCVADLESEVAGRRDRAILALQDLDDRLAIDVLVRLLKHRNPEVRVLVLRPLFTMRAHGAIPAIIELLKDDDTRVRSQALNTLLNLTQHATPEIGYSYWIDWWRNVGQARFRGPDPAAADGAPDPIDPSPAR
ncbi:MAG: tetratricopeptide repeat protein [Planctomycetes bacterium]|nr:tetratricopeptide repeat protein [Planctomycetota bacterium]